MVINTEISKKDLDALSALSDEELRERILSAVSACGIDRAKAAARLPDVRIIRRKLASLSDKDIKTLTAAFGEKAASAFADGLLNGTK